MLVKAKFKVGDVVSVENISDFNPASQVTTVGKIKAIHLFKGEGLYSDGDESGIVKYDIDGCSLVRQDEHKITMVEKA